VFAVGLLLVELSLQEMYVCVNMYTLRSRRPAQADGPKLRAGQAAAAVAPPPASSVSEQYKVKMVHDRGGGRGRGTHASPWRGGP
jgi:hypothetical protein